jgi:hypothetical protein
MKYLVVLKSGAQVEFTADSSSNIGGHVIYTLNGKHVATIELSRIDATILEQPKRKLGF